MGPACGLWIPLGTRDEADATVERLVRLLGGGLSGHHRLGFGGRDMRPIGGRLHESGSNLCCGAFRIDPEIEGYEDGVEEAFGFRPDPEVISISVGCNLPDDHRALAVAAAYLAEQTGGVIDLDKPPWSLHRSPWSDGALPGRVRRVCWNGNRKFGWKLLLDGEAMRAWSRHPDCQMPK